MLNEFPRLISPLRCQRRQYHKLRHILIVGTIPCLCHSYLLTEIFNETIANICVARELNET